MPEMNGSEFLERAKEVFPHAIRMLLTGYSDMEAIVDAVNRGEIHRYLTKPWNDDDLLLQVRQSLEQYELVLENRRLLNLTKKQNAELEELNSSLEQKVEERTREVHQKNRQLKELNQQLESNLFNTVRAFASLVEMLTPSLAGHGTRVAAISRKIAEDLGVDGEERTQIEMAGLLHDFGKLGFPEKLLKHEAHDWNRQEKGIFRKHPERGQAAVQFINNLEHAGLLIRSHHEQYDGQGYPDQLAEEEIPYGARIIAVADAYDKIVGLRMLDRETRKKVAGNNGLSEEVLQQAAILHLKEMAFTRYDPDVVKAFLARLKAKGIDYGRKKDVLLQELKPGMVLAGAVHARSGRFLLPKEAVLTADIISKLRRIHELEPLDEPFLVELKQ
jgi:response regulator RpfG family c-di-GMP phosphodiesterase